MDTIIVSSDVVACDPGCNHISSYEGSIPIAEVQPDTELTRHTIKDTWWQGTINAKFDCLYLKEVRSDGVLFLYGKQEVLVRAGEFTKLQQVGLSYAYAELFVSVH